MGRPAKPAKIYELDNSKSHRTKKEIASRKKAEAECLTGEVLHEKEMTRKDEFAHKKFLEMRKMLKALDKNDAIYSETINRYCMLLSEENDTMKNRKRFLKKLEEAAGVDEFELYAGLVDRYDRRLKSIRDQLFAIEKENAMTIAGTLRMIPKKPEKKKSALEEALSG